MANPEKQISHSDQSREKPKPKAKFIRYDFKPEGYVHVDDAEFLNQFLSFLYEKNLESRQLIFRGIDASRIIEHNKVIERPPAVFGMNETAWKTEAEKPFGETTPGGYTKFAEQPAIALYDALQLAQPHNYDLELDPKNPTRIVEITDIVTGEPLANLDLDARLEEVFTHKDYPKDPNASPTDALVGIVYIEDQ